MDLEDQGHTLRPSKDGGGRVICSRYEDEVKDVSGDLCLLCLCTTKGREIEVEVELRLRADVGQ